MQWIWQLNNWPHFEFGSSTFKTQENLFVHTHGIITGATKNTSESDCEQLKISVLTQEGVATATIEGEMVQRDSVQSSIRKHLGLQTDSRKIQPNEAGIAELMVDVYKNFDQPLTHELLYNWHKMVNNGRRDLESIGSYRQHPEPMQIVSGNLTRPQVFYEAPPSSAMMEEMNQFIEWYNANLTNTDLPTIVFAGIAHLYFEIIHPFEDGNGRIGRALVEKAVSQRLGAPALNSFSKIIEVDRKGYYTALQGCNHTLNVTKWLLYFSKTLLDAQKYTLDMVEFLIAKAKYFDKFGRHINERQTKVLLRIFEAGLDGFQGGLRAGNYKTITASSPATVTRDLQDLVAMGALNQTGQLKHTRYALNLNGL